MDTHSHSGAVCWICLEGGGGADDTTGGREPLVRNCACRGSDAGFGHLSCIIKYAEQKCEQATTLFDEQYVSPWEKCPICKKGYQHDVAISLSDAFVSYAERTYDHPGNKLEDKVKVMEALRLQIITIRNDILILPENFTHDRVRCAMNIPVRKLLGIVDRAKVDHNMEGWVHMDPSTPEFQRYRYISDTFQAFGYWCLGQFYALDKTEESRNTEIGFYVQARDIHNSVGSKEKANSISDLIRLTMAKYEGGNEAESLKSSKKFYHDALRNFGGESESTLSIGISYASHLASANHSIEAERLATKFVDTTHQVYGQEHQLSQTSAQTLRNCKRRFIYKATPQYSDGNALQYLALRYENDGKVCIISGPITQSRFDEEEITIDEGQTCGIESALVIPAVGCPVICHGLVNASHLNGKLGDVRSIISSDKGGGIDELRLGVYFEDKSLKSAAVKPANLRIAFVLPST